MALSHFDGEDPVAFALEDLNLSGAIDASSFFEFVTPLSSSSLRSLTLPSFAPGSDTPILAWFSRLATLYLTLHSLTPDPTPILVQLPLLPLGHLSINNNFSPPISSFAFLPPTLEHLTLPNIHFREILPFTESGQCPRLDYFRTRSTR